MLVIETELAITKRLASQLVAEHFRDNKRETEVKISASNVTAIYSYKGQRTNLARICENVVLVRSSKKLARGDYPMIIARLILQRTKAQIMANESPVISAAEASFVVENATHEDIECYHVEYGIIHNIHDNW